MHELSLSYSIVESVLDSLRGHEVNTVRRVTLSIGELSGVAIDALRFSFPIAAAGTLVEGAELEVVSVPVVVFCPHCGQKGRLANIQSFRCPAWGQPTGQIVAGRELEISSLEVDMKENVPHEYAHPGTPPEHSEQERRTGPAAA